MSAHYSPPRPAEEVAREMVREVSEYSEGLGFRIALEIRDGVGRVFVNVETRGEVEDLRSLLGRIYERGRADGGAAARADGIVEGLRKARSVVFATVSGEIEDELNRGIDEAIDDVVRRFQKQRAREEGAAAALRAIAPADREHLGREVRAVWISWAREQPAPKPTWLLSWDDLTDAYQEVGRRIGERLFAMGAAAERARQQPAETVEQQEARHLAALARAREASYDDALYVEPQQPRDLAGRIRALIQEYAGRWADAHGTTHRSGAWQEVMRQLREALADVERVGAVSAWRIANMRKGHPSGGLFTDGLVKAANELEAIVRESAMEAP